MYVLDTSAIIEIINGTKKGSDIVSDINNKRVFSTVFSYYEIMRGIRDNELTNVEDFFNSISLIEFDKTSSANSAEIERVLTNSGKMINKIDIFIAAICLTNNMSLITLDKDFKSIHGMRLKFYE